MQLFSIPDFKIIVSHKDVELLACNLSALKKQTITIGRHGCDIVLPEADSLVSRHHATLEFRKGRWVLRDAKSRNGIWLDGLRHEKPIALEVGQRFIIGACRLTIEKPEVKRDMTILSPYHILVRMNGPRQGERIALKTFPVVFGKSPEKIAAKETTRDYQVVPLLETLASHVHARLVEQPQETNHELGLFLQDCNSTNGSYVNDTQQHAEMNMRLLSEGDVLRFATEEFRFLDKAFPHDDPKKTMRKGLIGGGVFLAVLFGFGAWWHFCCAPAQRLLNQATALGNNRQFAAATQVLDEAFQSPGATLVSGGLNALKENLDQWRRTSVAWEAYLQAWRKTRMNGDVTPQTELDPEQRSLWPKALEAQRRATIVLKRAALRYETLRAVMTTATAPLSNEDLEFLCQPQIFTEAEVKDLATAGLGTMHELWYANLQLWTEQAKQDADYLLKVRTVSLDDLDEMLRTNRTIGIGKRGFKKSVAQSSVPALRDEFAAWAKMSAWVKDCRSQAHRVVVGNFTLAGADVPEAKLTDAPLVGLPEGVAERANAFLRLRKGEIALSAQIGVPTSQAPAELERYLNWIRALATECGTFVYTLLDEYKDTDAGQAYREALIHEQTR